MSNESWTSSAATIRKPPNCSICLRVDFIASSAAWTFVTCCSSTFLSREFARRVAWRYRKGMSVASKPPTADRVIIRDVSWQTYECLLKDLENRSAPRLAYDRGILEIMSPPFGHEEVNRALAAIVEIVLEEMEIDFRNAGSTTFKREDQERGFEPDSSFYIRNVERVRGKNKLDMNVDPPPDLLIEVDLTHNSLNKFPLYTALAVPEVWRYTDVLTIWLLNEG